MVCVPVFYPIPSFTPQVYSNPRSFRVPLFGIIYSLTSAIFSIYVFMANLANIDLHQWQTSPDRKYTF